MSRAYAVPLQLPQDAKDIPGYIFNFVSTWDTAKSTQTAFNVINENMYSGVHWVFFDLADGVVKGDDQVIMDGGAIRNYFKLVIDAVVSKLTREEWVPSAATSSGSPSRNRCANLTSAFVRDVKRRNGGAMRDKRRVLADILRADGFTRCEIDEDALDDLVCTPEQLNIITNQYGQSPLHVQPLSEGKLLARFQMGHIKEVDVSSSCVVVPGGVLNFNDPSDCRQFAVVEFLPIQTIRRLAEKLGSDPDKVSPVTSYDYRTIGLSQMAVVTNNSYGYDKRPNSQRGYVLDGRGMTGKLCSYWEMDSQGYWTVSYSTNYALDNYIGTEGAFPTHPYVKRSTWVNPSSVWSNGHGDELIKSQRSINKMNATRDRHYQRMLKDVILRPQGSRLENITSSLGTTVADYDPVKGAPIRWTADYGQLQYFERKIEGAIAEIFRLGKISPIAQGIIPPRTASETYESAIKQSLEDLQPLQTEFFAADNILRQKEVMLAKSSGLFDKSRLGYLLLPTGDSYYDEYSDYDLLPGTEFEYKPVPAGPQTPEDRYQQSKELLSMGLFAEGPEYDAIRRRYRAFVATGSIGSLEPEVEAYARLHAVKNMQLIKTNKVRVIQTEQPIDTPQGPSTEMIPVVVGPSGEVLYQDWMVHSVMIENYSNFVQNPQTSEDQRQIALVLLSMHQQAESADIAAAKKQQNIDTSEQMQAEASGNVLTTIVSAQSKQDSITGVKTPRQGGVESGRVRALA